MKSYLFSFFLIISSSSFSQTINHIIENKQKHKEMIQQVIKEYAKKFSDVASDENIRALTGLNKSPNIETSVKDLASDVKTMLEKRKTSGGSLTQSELILINDSFESMESKAAGNKTITKILNDLKLEVELMKFYSLLNTTADNLTIDSLLNSIDFLSKSLAQLKSKNKTNKELDDIEKALTKKKQECIQLKIDSYSSSYNVYDITNTATYLKENSNELTNLSVGNYDLLFDQQGILTNYKERNLKNIEPKAIKIITDNGIDIPLPTKISFSIVSKDSILVSTNYYSSTSKDVFFNNTTKSFVFKEIPNSSKVNIINDSFIGKKQIKVVYQFKNDKLANGILLKFDSYTKEEIKDILKK